MHFITPQVLWLLAIVPPLIGLAIWLAWRRNRTLLKQYGEEKLVAPLSEFVPAAVYVGKALCLGLGLALLVVALSRPSIKHGTAEFPRGSIDVIAIVDVSRSMAVPDYKGALANTDEAEGRRLDMARHLILKDVVPSLNYNRLGIVTYSGSAFPMAFLSDDMVALDWMLRRALIMGSAPGEGSEMAGAFRLAYTLFDLDSKPDHRKIIVLFSDGGNDSALPDTQAILVELQKRGIELIIVGLGKPVASPIPVRLLSKGDQSRLYRQENYEFEGQVVTSKLDENTLLLMRNMVGARYVRVVDPSDFRIGMLISKADAKFKEGEQELFMYPLAVAMLLLLASLFIPRALRPSGPGGYIFRRQERDTTGNDRKRR